MDILVVRLVVATLIAFKVFDDFFATMLTIAYRLNMGLAAENLGQLTPGDNYSRLIPLMDAVPIWLHALWVLAGCLYLVAFVLVIWGKGRAHLLVLAALCVEIIARLVGQPVIDATGIVVNPNPSIIASVVIPYVLPLFLALLLSRQSAR
jgi:hypothetical protein